MVTARPQESRAGLSGASQLPRSSRVAREYGEGVLARVGKGRRVLARME